ncbi:DUF2207 domain-containing protein [Actinomadura hibisca]|uniref:DUF2207 domain-containing protein n=1 Tax=Actinomadura hibisca TaxID=68565 RepID=UPI000834567C|nr:DUF2207 domain-containing protein [Actinomadura hibisca]
MSRARSHAHGRTGPAALLLSLLLPVLLWTAGPARADAAAEQITSYRVEMAVGRDGGLHVKETVAYDFGPAAKHGVYRYVPRLDRADAKRDRRYDLANVQVSADGTTVPTTVTTSGDRTEIRIGDPAGTVTGAHTYTIEYDVPRALTAYSDHDELYWDAVGDGWPVPIAQAAVTVAVPVATTGVTCFTGPSGSTKPCASATGQGTGTASFTQPALAAGEGLTIAVKWPKGAVTVQPPAYEKRPREGVSGWAVAIACAWLLVPLAMAVRGLPRRGGRKPSSPLPEPPPGVRPALAGALLSGKGDSLQIVATLVDLAARGELRIEEAGDSFTLVRPGGFDLASAGPHLAPYETTLLSGLFAHREEVPVTALSGAFAPVRSAAQRQIMDECVRLGWFRRHPDRQRRRQRVLSGVLLALAPFVFVGLVFLTIGRNGTTAAFNDAFWIAAAQAVAGLAVVLLALLVQPRTALGAQISGQVRGYRDHLRRGPVPLGSQGEIAATVGRALPFAIAFGLHHGYARLLAAHGVRTPPWYAHRGSIEGFGGSLASFTAVTTTMVTPPSASGGSGGGGGGFSGGGDSGGGGGGGGGGSW